MEQQGMSKMNLFWVGFYFLFILWIGFGMFVGRLATIFMAILKIPMNSFFGGLLGIVFALAIFSLIIYLVFGRTGKVKYVLLGFFTAIGILILWLGSCMGVIAIAGDEAMIIAMIAAVVLPAIAMRIVTKKMKEAWAEEKYPQTNPKMHEIWQN